MEVGGTAAEFDGSFKNNDGHCAVNVVITVDQDRIFSFNSCVDAVNRAAEAGHVLGQMQMSERGSKENELADSASLNPRRSSRPARI